MTEIAARLAEYGIRLGMPGPGEHKALCPQCSATRRHKRDPCLSVTVEADGGAVWNCHHCGWNGGFGPAHSPSRIVPRHKPRATPRKPAPPKGSLPPNVVAWFAARGIGTDVLARNGVVYTETWMPGCEPGQAMAVIAFPYRRGGEVVNVKYRSADKRFRQEKGAEKVFYGIDDIVGFTECVIVEGECDKLALEEAGFLNVLSVPDGAPQRVRDEPIDPEDDDKFSYVWTCRDALKPMTKIVLATDADTPGMALAEELARRLGKEICWRVDWPVVGDVQRKDANDVLVGDGAQVLRECIERARPWPIRSLHEPEEYLDEVFDLYRTGTAKTLSTGWAGLDPYLTIRPGELSVVTGTPGSGKSEWLDALAVNLATVHGWRFAVCSFENPAPEHIAKLAEKHVGAPFRDGYRPRMGEGDLAAAVAWLNRHFVLIRADDAAPTVDWVLETARAAVMRYGVRGLIVDPWNEIEHKRPAGMNETEYVSQVLGKLRRFATLHDTHVWIVAHPAKLYRLADGKLPVPSLYDISGSAHWVNKADVGIVVHRDPDRMPPCTEIHIRKVRFKSVGKIGVTTLRYDPPTGRYSDMEDVWDDGP